jgi:hypothetical protein
MEPREKENILVLCFHLFTRKKEEEQKSFKESFLSSHPYAIHRSDYLGLGSWHRKAWRSRGAREEGTEKRETKISVRLQIPSSALGFGSKGRRLNRTPTLCTNCLGLL